MAYTSPTATASGTTFAQFQAGGLSGHLERCIAAQTTPPAKTLEFLRLCEDGRGQAAYDYLASLIRNFVAGEPQAESDVITDLKKAHLAFLMLATLCAEAGVLIDANQGTLGSAATAIGGRKVVRTWS